MSAARNGRASVRCASGRTLSCAVTASRREFDRALLAKVPDDPQDLTADQIKLKAIRDELGAPQAGEPMQKVLTPEAYAKYMDGTYGNRAQGSVTRLDDGAQMRSPKELHDGLRLD